MGFKFVNVEGGLQFNSFLLLLDTIKFVLLGLFQVKNLRVLQLVCSLNLLLETLHLIRKGFLDRLVVLLDLFFEFLLFESKLIFVFLDLGIKSVFVVIFFVAKLLSVDGILVRAQLMDILNLLVMGLSLIFELFVELLDHDVVLSLMADVIV